MEYPKPQINIDGTWYDVLSFEEFKVARGLQQTPNPTIAYNLKTGHLDFTTIGHFRYIIWNERAKEFTPLIRRPRTATL